MSHQQPYGYPVPLHQTQVLVQPYRCSTAHVVVAWVVAVLNRFSMPPWAVAAMRNRRNVGSVAVVDPLGSEPTQELPRSPWEPDHRR